MIRSRFHSILAGLLAGALTLTALCLYFGWSLNPKAASALARVSYSCPMHPEVARPAPGKCPKCQMPLQQIRPAQTVQKDEDGCANHPSGCCNDKKVVSYQLPPGHPPVPGYTVAKSTNAANQSVACPGATGQTPAPAEAGR